MIPTCGAGVTAAAGTGLAHHLFFKVFALEKSLVKTKHSGFPHHAFAQCEVFAPAALRGARASVSVPFSGPHLSMPLPIFGLVVLYTTNNLIGRRLILRRLRFKRKNVPIIFFYPALSSVSQGYSRSKVRLSTCY